MARINYIDVANVREVWDYVEVQVPITTIAISDGLPIHDGLLSLDAVFSHEAKSIVVPKILFVKEYEPSGTLKENQLRVEFFLDSGAVVTANQSIKVKSLDVITKVDVVATETSYTKYANEAGTQVWSISRKALDVVSHVYKRTSSSLYCVLKAQGVYNAYISTSKLYFGMFYILL